MRKKILLFIIRLIRFFHKEDSLMPELSSVPDGAIRTNRLYTHYGRILFARPNPERVRFYIDGEEVTPLAFEEATRNPEPGQVVTRDGQACDRCCCDRYGLPCRCDFASGSYSGYYELLHSSRQYADNTTL